MIRGQGNLHLPDIARQMTQQVGIAGNRPIALGNNPLPRLGSTEVNELRLAQRGKTVPGG